jgi:nucleotide-binding universal stress UspA family protein
VYKNIIIGVDGSKEAHDALKKVIALYKDWNNKIVVFHSVEHHMIPVSMPIFTTAYSFPLNTYSEIRDEYIKIGNHILEEAKKMFESKGIPIETRLVEDMKPEEKFDLVVLGGKGQHSKIESLLGTVSTHVVNNAHCDVLIVR